jgi:hypothetical protein
VILVLELIDARMWTWLLKFLPKFSVLAAQKEKHETEIMLLKAKHEKETEVLNADIRNLRSEADRVKQELSKRPKPVHTSERSEVEMEILSLLALRGDGPNSTDTFAAILKIRVQTAEFYLNELCEAGLVTFSDWDGRASWHLEQEGRRYLHQRGLLN